MEAKNLIELIEYNDTSVTDKAGDTTLIRLERIVRLNLIIPTERDQLVNALPETCTKILESLSVLKLITLLSFLDGCKFSQEELSIVVVTFKIYLEETSKSDYSNEEISCRGMIMRFLAKNEYYSISELEKEVVVKEKVMFLYADCLICFNKEELISFVVKILTIEPKSGVVGLMDRLPAWKKILTPAQAKDATEQWLKVLDGSGKELLQKWIVNFKFSI